MVFVLFVETKQKTRKYTKKSVMKQKLPRKMCENRLKLPQKMCKNKKYPENMQKLRKQYSKNMQNLKTKCLYAKIYLEKQIKKQ